MCRTTGRGRLEHGICPLRSGQLSAELSILLPASFNVCCIWIVWKTTTMHPPYCAALKKGASRRWNSLLISEWRMQLNFTSVSPSVVIKPPSPNPIFTQGPFYCSCFFNDHSAWVYLAWILHFKTASISQNQYAGLGFWFMVSCAGFGCDHWRCYGSQLSCAPTIWELWKPASGRAEQMVSALH